MFRPYRVIIRMISETLMKYTNHIMVERSHFLQIILQSSLFVFSSVLKFSDCSSFIHSVFCLTTGPKPPPKRCLHIVRSRASSFKWEYPLLSLRSSSSFLRLLPRLLATSISPFIFPSIMSMKNSNYAIGNRTRELPVCSAVPCRQTDEHDEANSLSFSLSNGTAARGGPRPPSRISSILPGLGWPLSSFYTLALLYLPSLRLPNAAWVSFWGPFHLAHWGGLSCINHRHPAIWHALPISIYSACRISQCHSHHTIDRVLG